MCFIIFTSPLASLLSFLFNVAGLGLYICSSLLDVFSFTLLTSHFSSLIPSVFALPSLSFHLPLLEKKKSLNTVSMPLIVPKWERNFLCSEPDWFLSLWLYSWQPLRVCLFNVFTKLPVAIYPVVPPCQSSGVQANWHSRCSIADRPICSERYSSQEAPVHPVGRKRNRTIAKVQPESATGRLAMFTSRSGRGLERDSCNWE